jgi:hypothetical protein
VDSTVAGRETDHAMTIVTYAYRPRRARKRKHPVEIPQRIVSVTKPKPAAPAIGKAVTESKRPAAQPAAINTGSRIVTARNPRARRLSDVPEMTPEEHQRRGDAAEALFKEIARRARE